MGMGKSFRNVGTLFTLVSISAGVVTGFVSHDLLSTRFHGDTVSLSRFPGTSFEYAGIKNVKYGVLQQVRQPPLLQNRNYLPQRSSLHTHRGPIDSQGSRSIAYAASFLFVSLRQFMRTKRKSTHKSTFPVDTTSHATISSKNVLVAILTIVTDLLRKWSRVFRRGAIILAMMAIFVFHTPPPTWAVSGGRMGGSFKQAPSRSSYSPSRSSRPRARPNRSYSAPPLYYHHQPRPTIVISGPGPTATHYGSSTAPFGMQRQARRRIGASDIILIAGTTALVANGVRNNLMRGNEMDPRNKHSQRSALGLGVSVVSLTVALNVPNRDDPNSILSKLKYISQTARTDSRAGVQQLVSKTVLELLRQEQSIVSVDWSCQNFAQVRNADLTFNRISMEQRSKFDRETENNFGGDTRPDGLPKPRRNEEETSYRATSAVLCITLSLEGDSMNSIGNKIRSRRDLKKALLQIGGDSQVDNCLLGAEILWAPEDRTESLSEQDIYADYPSLYPLLD